MLPVDAHVPLVVVPPPRSLALARLPVPVLSVPRCWLVFVGRLLVLEHVWPRRRLPPVLVLPQLVGAMKSRSNLWLVANVPRRRCVPSRRSPRLRRRQLSVALAV